MGNYSTWVVLKHVRLMKDDGHKSCDDAERADL